MSFKELDIKKEYRSLLDSVAKDFYIPLLIQAVKYQRAVGFFSSSCLVEISKGISELAKIPSRDELLSKLLGSLQSPITNFARVIKQIAEQGGEAAPAEAAEETATDAE